MESIPRLGGLHHPTPWQLKALTPHTESSLVREDLHV